MFVSNAQSAFHYKLNKGLDISLGTGSVALFSASYLLQRKVEPLPEATILKLKREDVNAFDRIATYQWSKNAARISDGLAIGSILMKSYFYINKETRSESVKIGTVALQSLLLSQGIANAMKLTLRNRPFLYNDKVAMEEKLQAGSRLSFFSGHTTTVSSTCFSFAFAHQMYLPESKRNKYIWMGAFTLPAVEGFLRVKAGKHYPSDVIVAYIVGFGTSYFMHRIHRAAK